MEGSGDSNTVSLAVNGQTASYSAPRMAIGRIRYYVNGRSGDDGKTHDTALFY